MKSILILSALIAAPVYGEIFQTQLTYQVVPTVVTGSLNPFTLAVDGQKITPPVDGKIDRIEINGTVIETVKKGNEPFFLQTNAEEIEFVAYRNDSRYALSKLILPKLNSFEVKQSEIIFNYTGSVGAVFFDDKEIPMKSGESHLFLPSESKWFKSVHVLELRNSTEPSRLYNVKFSREEIEPAGWLRPNYQIGIGVANPPIENDWGGTLSFSVGFPFRLVTSLLLIASPRFQSNGNEVYSIMGHLGWQVFRHGEGPRRAVWLESGFWIGEAWVHSRYENPAHTPSVNESRYSGTQYGVYLRSEPLRFGSFGLSHFVQIPFRAISRPYSSGGGDGPRMGVEFHIHL